MRVAVRDMAEMFPAFRVIDTLEFEFVIVSLIVSDVMCENAPRFNTAQVT